jgi:hypothetical protein
LVQLWIVWLNARLFHVRGLPAAAHIDLVLHNFSVVPDSLLLCFSKRLLHRFFI